MKQPKIRIKPYKKTDKKTAKLMEAYANWLWEDVDFQQQLRWRMMEEIEREINPLGLVYVKWIFPLPSKKEKI